MWKGHLEVEVVKEWKQSVEEIPPDYFLSGADEKSPVCEEDQIFHARLIWFAELPYMFTPWWLSEYCQITRYTRTWSEKPKGAGMFEGKIDMIISNREWMTSGEMWVQKNTKTLSNTRWFRKGITCRPRYCKSTVRTDSQLSLGGNCNFYSS